MDKIDGTKKKKQFLNLKEKLFIVKYKDTNEKASLTDVCKAAGTQFDRPFTKTSIFNTLKLLV